VIQLPHAVTACAARANYSIADSPWPLAMQASAELCWRATSEQELGILTSSWPWPSGIGHQIQGSALACDAKIQFSIVVQHDSNS